MTRSKDVAATAVDRIVQTLRRQILSGELNLDQQLPTVPELSVEYSVSLNTARQALAVLAGQGLVTVKRGATGGSFVTVPSPEQISTSWQTGLALMSQNAHVSVAELMEIREVLEITAAEMAAFRRTDDDLASIRAALFDSSAVDPGQASLQNRLFHTGVLRATHNPLFELVAEPVRTVLQARLKRDIAPPTFWRDVDHDHREILSFIEARDQVGAREASRAHLRTLREDSEYV